MTLSVQNAYDEYVADGTNAAFVFNFTVPTYNPTPILVYRDGVAAAAGDYTVTPGAGSGGTVTFVDGAGADDPPLAEVVVLIRRSIPIDQNLELNDFAPFPADDVETELDKLTMISQDLKSMEPILDGVDARAREEADRAHDEAEKSAASAAESAASAAESASSAAAAKQSEIQAGQSAADAIEAAHASAQSAGDSSVSAVEAEGFRNEAEGFRNEAEGFRDETEVLKTETEATYTEFQDEYWGEYYWDTTTAAPSVNPKTGTVPNVGDLLFNTYDGMMYVCSSTEPYTWIPTGQAGVSQIVAGQNIELSPTDGKGVVRVTSKNTGDVDEVVIGRYEGTLLYNQPIPTQTSEGVDIVYRNGDYFVFVGPDGDRTVPPTGFVQTGDYCICTTGTKGPADDYSVLEEQIQKNATEIAYNDIDIKELEGTTTVGSSVVSVDGGNYFNGR